MRSGRGCWGACRRYESRALAVIPRHVPPATLPRPWRGRLGSGSCRKNCRRSADARTRGTPGRDPREPPCGRRPDPSERGAARVSASAVPEGAHRDVLAQPRSEARRLAGFIHGLGGQRPTGNISREEPWAGLVDLAATASSTIVPKQGQQSGREHDVAILGPFALIDTNDHAFAIDVAARRRTSHG